jgi:GNAT superfamily N-acetyltransferase
MLPTPGSPRFADSCEDGRAFVTPTIVPATAADLGALLTLMREFYASERLPFDPAVATDGLQQLFADPSSGAVYLIALEGGAAGYFVLGFNFSLEFHGRYVWIDELYVREAWRGHGLGSAALSFVERICRDRGYAAVRLEVARRNAAAERLYRRSGYDDYDRDLLTKRVR